MLSARRFLLAVAASALIAPAFGQSFDTSGVKFDPGVTVGNAKLQLNGAGTRYKFVVKVYAAGLYLPSKAGAPEQVLSANGPRRMHIHMLREIDANELGKLFTRGMQDNATKDEFSKSIPGTIKMGEIFATRKKLAKDDFFTIDYLPGTGTVISVNGKPAAEPIKEPEFFSALMSIWLGRNPADAQLKDALLGKPREG